MFTDDPRLPGRVRAPELPRSADRWIGSPPLSLLELRGRPVLLDFWTGGCINCHHILPDLDRLARAFPALVVIGVHTGKFTAERSREAVARAAAQLGVTHPVVNDPDGDLWRAYAVRAWPTVVLIDPAGRIVGQRSGEGVFRAFESLIAETVGDATSDDTRPVLFSPLPPAGALRFPGGLALDRDRGSLWVAETGAHRLLELDPVTADVRRIVGDGQPGFGDGSAESARFRAPRGLWIQGATLFVADTDNHAVRSVDLATGAVSTLAGSGEQATRWDEPGIGRDVRLNSPWAIAPLPDGALVVSMAGFHQLWRIDPVTGAADPWVGSGREALIDGPRRGGPADGAALAQPSGLAADGDAIYIADAESSAVRRFDPASGFVTTLVGAGLFEFGDTDGVGAAVRLQHPLDVTVARDELIVADSYNHRIKSIRLTDCRTTSIAGSGEAGFADGVGGEARFAEPSALVATGDAVFIADLGNGAIRRLDLATRTVTTLPVVVPSVWSLDLPPGESLVPLRFDLPDGQHTAEGTAWTVAVDTSDNRIVRAATSDGAIRFDASPGGAVVKLTASGYLCDDRSGTCRPTTVRAVLRLTIRPAAAPPDSLCLPVPT